MLANDILELASWLVIVVGTAALVLEPLVEWVGR